MHTIFCQLTTAGWMTSSMLSACVLQAEALSMKSIQLNADKAAAESALALKEEEVKLTHLLTVDAGVLNLRQQIQLTKAPSHQAKLLCNLFQLVKPVNFKQQTQLLCIQTARMYYMHLPSCFAPLFHLCRPVGGQVPEAADSAT